MNNKLFKKVTIVLCFLMIVSSLLASAQERISYGTGSTGGLYFVAGTAVTSVLNDVLDNINVVPQSIMGSAHGTLQVDRWELDMAQVTVDVASHGWHGLEEFKEKTEDIRAAMAIFTMGSSFVVREDSKINSLADTKGMSFGANSPMEERRIKAAMSLYGFKDNDYKIRLISYGEQANALKDGTLDVALLSTYPKNSTVEELSFTTKVKFISLDEDIAEQFGKEHFYWMPFDLPQGTYDNQDYPVLSPSLRGLLIVNKNVKEDIVYKIVKTITDNVDKIGEIHPIGNQYTVEQTKNYIENGLIPIPWHKGAENFWKEKGIF